MTADIIQKTCVIGCIDRSPSAIAVCHASTWIAQTLKLPLTLLHMNEKISTSAHHDLSGVIGFDTRETLLNELVDIEEKRARLTREEGRQLLMSAKEITQDLGLLDAVAFGRDYISNPDLVVRLKQKAALNPQHPETFYGGGEQGYTDYPFLV